MSAWLDAVSSLKAKLGLLVVASVVTAVLLTLLGSAADVSPLLVLPVSVALALGVTQLLAAGMVAPLRRMTEVSRAMARGDYTGRVRTSATDEVGQLAAAFNRMAEDLATVDRERRDLIATVSHELRTPLTAMTALLENLADGVVPADSQHLGAALEQAQRLGRLVDDLLQLSRLEAGVVDLDRQDVALRALVEDVRRPGARHRPDRRRRDGRRRRPRGRRRPGPAAPAARQRGRQRGAPRARRTPSACAVGGRQPGPTAAWWLEVIDAGGGVAPEDRERVFERFGTDGAGGTGLGLAVARWVAQLHGGTLRFLDPEAGQGARLRLEVPASSAPPPSSPRRHPIPSAAHDRRRPSPHRPSRRPDDPAPAARAGRRCSAASGPSRGRPARAPDRRRRGGGRARRRHRPVVHRGRHHLDAGRADVRRGRAGHRASAPRAVDPRCARDWPLLLVAADDPARRLVGRRCSGSSPRRPCSCAASPVPARCPASCCPGSRGRSRRCAACRGSAGRCGSPAPGRARRPWCVRRCGRCWASASSARSSPAPTPSSGRGSTSSCPT